MDESGRDETSSRDVSSKNCTALIYSQNSSVYTQVSDKSTILTSACHSTQKPMPLSAGYVEGQPITLLRDSGCRNIVVRKSLVKDENFTGKHETCVFIRQHETSRSSGKGLYRFSLCIRRVRGLVYGKSCF